MSREIKFRALKDDMANMRFYYGSLIHEKDGTPRIYDDHINLFHTCLKGTECQSIGLKDVADTPIYEHDIIEACMGWMKGDGYKKKGYPDKIRLWLEVIYGDGKGMEVGWHLNKINIHPEDRKAASEYFYREFRYNLKESWENDYQEHRVLYFGKNLDLKIIGNSIEHPELKNK
jgi:hypothetical protein